MRSIESPKRPARRPIRLAARLVVAACLLVAVGPLPSQAASAAKAWPRWETPEEAGFSSARLAEAEQYWFALRDAPIAAFFAVYKGRVLASFGTETATYQCHSMRKSFLSALYGIEVANGTIDLGATLEELGIDDDPPLTLAEKQAKVIDLLRARSGVYHAAACETPEMRDARPDRGSHPPGTFFYYNNWDFNALGTIYRQETGRDIFEDFQSRIARRVGMEDFQTSRCFYDYDMEYSIHPCYKFRMSARDRARFGQLFLQNGRWGKRQIIPETWVEESTRAHSDVSELAEIPGLGYGYMWPVFAPGFFGYLFSDSRLHDLHGFAAAGYRGQWIFVLPDAEMVVVFAVDVPAGGELDLDETSEMLETLLTAREIIDLKLVRAKVNPKTPTTGSRVKLVAKSRNRSTGRSVPTTVDFYLSPQRNRTDLEDEMRWIGTAELPELAAGKRKTVRLRTSLPSDLPAGTYYLVSVLDRDKTNYDLSRDNNIFLKKKTLEIQ
jgi:CubicO group peptidase (beta-lactamase class C family)